MLLLMLTINIGPDLLEIFENITSVRVFFETQCIFDRKLQLVQFTGPVVVRTLYNLI